MITRPLMGGLSNLETGVLQHQRATTTSGFCFLDWIESGQADRRRQRINREAVLVGKMLQYRAGWWRRERQRIERLSGVIVRTGLLLKAHREGLGAPEPLGFHRGYRVKYLIRDKGILNSAHLWDGENTLCKMWLTGGMNRDRKWSIHESTGFHPLCHMCQEVEKRNVPKITGAAHVNDCGCDVLPWEDCEHTADDAEAPQQIKAHC